MRYLTICVAAVAIISFCCVDAEARCKKRTKKRCGIFGRRCAKRVVKVCHRPLVKKARVCKECGDDK